MQEFAIPLTDSPEPADVEVVQQGLEAYDASQGHVTRRFSIYAVEAIRVQGFNPTCAGCSRR